MPYSLYVAAQCSAGERFWRAEYRRQHLCGELCTHHHFPHGPKDFDDKDDGRVVGNLIGLNLFDDYGIWCNYGQLHRDFTYCYSKGVFKRVLPAEEYAEIRWDQLEAGDPNFIKDFYYRLAHRVGNSVTLRTARMPLLNAGIWAKSTGVMPK